MFDRAPDPGGNPFRVLEVSELGERIQETLDALPEEYRALIHERQTLREMLAEAHGRQATATQRFS